LFARGSHAPLARLTAEGGHGIVTDQVGAPLVVLRADGEVAAQLVTDSRGRARVEGDGALCPWRFAGQYRDTETGLHYNRFRYYDADAGQYISRDPLGLRAGLRVYGYVADPGVQSDPLGLSPQAGGGCSSVDPEGEPFEDPAPPVYRRGHPSQPVVDHIKNRARGGHATNPNNLDIKTWEANSRKAGFEGNYMKDLQRYRSLGLSRADAEAVLSAEHDYIVRDVHARPVDPALLDELPDPGTT
jgi:RHS repeat-associated protein